MQRNTALFLLIAFIFSCSGNDQSDLSILDFRAEGSIDSSHLEVGKWKFYSLNSKEIKQEGFYENGVRSGLWKYYEGSIDTLHWMPLILPQCKYSIPSFLELQTTEPGFIYNAAVDTSQLFKVKIGLGKLESFDHASYQKVLTSELEENSRKVTSRRFSIIDNTCGERFYLNEFVGVDLYGVKYRLLTINSFKSGELIEVTLRASFDKRDLIDIVFHGVITSLFVNDKRFFDQNIECEVLLNKSTTKWSFSCNTLKS